MAKVAKLILVLLFAGIVVSLLVYGAVEIISGLRVGDSCQAILGGFMMFFSLMLVVLANPPR